MEPDLARYVIRYYGHFMNLTEHLAYRHLAGAMKATKGGSDISAQAEAKKSMIHSRLLSEDPAVLLLARNGLQPFAEVTAERILAEHGEKVFLNRCPRCQGLARTPSPRQCRACGLDWHESSGFVSG
jgi:hypothetical protein